MEELLSELIHIAGKEVLPLEYRATLLNPKESVKQCSQPARGDYFSCAARNIFYRLRRGKVGNVQYDTTSELGFTRTWSFVDAAALANALLEHMPEQATSSIVHSCALDDGIILITTCAYHLQQRESGMLQCPDCGYFFAGERGLKDHQLMKHHKAFIDAQDVISQSRMQLIPYRMPVGIPWMPISAREEIKPSIPEVCAPSESEVILQAAREGNLHLLRTLAGASPSDIHKACDRRGSNALLWAAGGGHLDVCRFLVEELGFDVHWVQPKDRRSALHWAARNGEVDVCRWLVVKGLDPNAPTCDGTVALHWAVWQGHQAACEWLVNEAGANLHATNTYGCNASQWAALAGNVPMCRWLLNAGLDLKLLNHNGHSALHKAALKGQRNVCEWLINEAGLGSAQMQADGDGNTPARMARNEGFDNLADWLDTQSTCV